MDAAYAEAMTLAETWSEANLGGFGLELHRIYGAQDNPKRGLLLLSAIHYGGASSLKGVAQAYDTLVRLIL